MTEVAEKGMTGAFFDSLVRTNKAIKGGRAIAIAEDARLIYKRHVEDLETALRRKELDLDNMLDLSPESAFSMKLASDFKAPEWVAKRHQLGVDIRNLKIEVDIARKDFDELFGPGEKEGS